MKTTFQRRITTKLPPTDLWNQIVAAFENSASHPFWPKEMERAQCSHLKMGALVHVKYKGFMKSTPVTYRITSFHPDRHSLRYESTGDHPLDGGATVSVLPSPKGGSELHWNGAYDYPWYSPLGMFLPYFLSRFFARLRENLREFEKEKRYRSQFAKVHSLEERRARKAAGR